MQEEKKMVMPNMMAVQIIENGINNKNSKITQEDFLVYVAMRRLADEAAAVKEIRESLNLQEDVWVFELLGFLAKPEIICDYLFDVHRNTIKTKLTSVKQSMVNLINNDLVYCYNKKEKVFIGGKDFSLLDEKEYKYIVLYFISPSGFYYALEKNVDKIIEYCKEKKIRSTEYYIVLYFVLEFYFNVSKYKNQCYLPNESAKYFTSKKKLWENVNNVFEQINIERKSKVLKNETGFATIHLFYKRDKYEELFEKTDEAVETEKSNKSFSSLFVEDTDVRLAAIIEQGLYDEKILSHNPELVKRGRELLELYEEWSKKS